MFATAVFASACGSKAPSSPSDLTISSQPQSQTITAGDSATLSVDGTGVSSLTYQWYVGTSGNAAKPIDGATGRSYTTPAMTETTSYWVRLWSTAASADSATAIVTVTPAEAPPTGTPGAAPAIVRSPESQTITQGQTANLSVEANGTGPLRYQWYSGSRGNTSSPVNETGTSFTTPALSSTTSYWVRVTNDHGSADSNAATITVNVPPPAPPPAPPSGTAPKISSHPQSQTINSGQTATLTIAATGTAPLTYQWYVGASGNQAQPISGATGTSFTTPALSQTTSYWVRISNPFGAENSNTATVTVNAAPPPPSGNPPTIVSQPQSATITTGQTATMSVVSSGTAPLSYQWYLGSSGTTTTPIGGATGSSFTTPALSTTTSYWVRVSNAHGASNSNTAVITVTPDASGSAFEDQVLALTNQRRAAGATCGGTAYPPVGPLTLSTTLRASARGHAGDMAAQNYFSHTSLDGRTFDQRIRNAGYTGSFPLGENIAGGQSTPQIVVDGWMNSAGHCANIMNGNFRSIGVGYAFSASSTYRHYWVQNFGGS